MKLPIPTHLQNILIPIGESNSDREVTGKIRCTCGGEAFALRESFLRNGQDRSLL